MQLDCYTYSEMGNATSIASRRQGLDLYSSMPIRAHAHAVKSSHAHSMVALRAAARALA